MSNYLPTHIWLSTFQSISMSSYLPSNPSLCLVIYLPSFLPSLGGAYRSQRGIQSARWTASCPTHCAHARREGSRVDFPLRWVMWYLLVQRNILTNWLYYTLPHSTVLQQSIIIRGGSTSEEGIQGRIQQRWVNYDHDDEMHDDDDDYNDDYMWYVSYTTLQYIASVKVCIAVGAGMW